MSVEMTGGETAWLLLLAVPALSAVLVFWHIQAYLADPRRHELNEAWFAQFEEFMRRKYRDPELRGRVHALDGHFHNQR